MHGRKLVLAHAVATLLTAGAAAGPTRQPAASKGDFIPATTREVTVPRTDASVTIDGEATEDAWTAAVCVGPLVLLGSGAIPEKDLTTCKLLYDHAALYLFVSCRAQAVEQVTLYHSPNQTWPHGKADRVEVFLNPFPDSEDQYHLDVARDGGCYDTFATAKDVPAKGLDWTGAWRAAVRQVDTGWTAEIALPFTTFGVSAVKPGDLWRFKIGRDNRRRGDGPIMWPLNPSGGFATRIADSALYFGRRNLLENGAFESGDVVNGVPKPWRGSVTRDDEELRGRSQGTFESVQGQGGRLGSRAVRCVKTELNSNLPQVWQHGLRLVPGAVYEFSILATGDLSQPVLRMAAYKEGQRVRLGKAFSPTTEFQRYAFRFVVPDGAERVDVGLGVARNVLGAVLYDDAVLRRVLDSEEALATVKGAFTPPTYDPLEEPLHGLDAFCERAGEKPWDLFQRGNAIATQRLVFTGTTFGTQVWMLDNSPGPQYNTTASLWQPWNADGSRLRSYGTRVLGEKTFGRWVYDAQFARLRPIAYSGLPIWDLRNTHVYYYFSRGEPRQVIKVDLETGDETTLASWPGPRGHRSHGMTKDGRALFVQDYNGGIWVPYDPAGRPLPTIGILDTSGILADETTPFPSNAFAAKSNDGHLFRIMTGMRVDVATGETTRVILPISGHTEYLRTFASGRVQFPADAELPATRDVPALFELYHLYPSTTHGHNSYSPDGEYLCWDGTPRHQRVKDGEDPHTVRISPNGVCYHVCWLYDPRFYITTVGSCLQDYRRPILGGVICQVFSDGTWQPIVDTKLRTYSFSFYHGSDFAMLSRDATKVTFASSMTGSIKCYIAVVQRPQPPRDLTWIAEQAAVRLRWTPPPRCREITGYFVYRSARSGDGYGLLTPEPIRGTTWQDVSVEPGTPYYYVLSSVESCGLISGYSAEAARAGIELPGRLTEPVIVYVEAERALSDLQTADYPGVSRGRDARAASGMYYLYRTPAGCGRGKASAGVACMPLAISIPGEYVVWLRTRKDSDDTATWHLSVGDRTAGEAQCPSRGWEWVRVDGQPLSLEAGRHRLACATADAGAQLDLICLATDTGFVPVGPRPEDTLPPDPVDGLVAQRVRDRAIRLRWQPSQALDVLYYNVYSARERFTQPAQRYRIASVGECDHVDWGLRPGATYHYAVTAVDRRGNESPVQGTVPAATAARERPERRIVLKFDEAVLAGDCEKGEAAGTRAASFILWPYRGRRDDNQVPQIEDSKAAWTIEVEQPGKYYFWLRTLPRGTPRGDYTPEMHQRIRVTLDGRGLCTLGRGQTDIATTDKGLRPEWWTWTAPVSSGQCIGVELPAGRHTLTLERMSGDIRYDVLLLTDEPSFIPKDGRLKLS